MKSRKMSKFLAGGALAIAASVVTPLTATAQVNAPECESGFICVDLSGYKLVDTNGDGEVEKVPTEAVDGAMIIVLGKDDNGPTVGRITDGLTGQEDVTAADGTFKIAIEDFANYEEFRVMIVVPKYFFLYRGSNFPEENSLGVPVNGTVVIDGATDVTPRYNYGVSNYTTENSFTAEVQFE